MRRCGAAAACNPLCVAAVQEELSPKRSEAVLAQQHLFSVYVHARAAYKDYPEGSVFQGRLIPDRAVRVQWLQGRAGMAEGPVDAGDGVGAGLPRLTGLKLCCCASKRPGQQDLTLPVVICPAGRAPRHAQHDGGHQEAGGSGSAGPAQRALCAGWQHHRCGMLHGFCCVCMSGSCVDAARLGCFVGCCRCVAAGSCMAQGASPGCCCFWWWCGLPALLCPCAARCASQPLLPPHAAVPLYHPAMFYQQLMSESKSRVDACPHEVGAAPLGESLLHSLSLTARCLGLAQLPGCLR